MGVIKVKKQKLKIKKNGSPKKSLGQNFLTSVGAINKIIASADLLPNLTILEVGPGRGVLTEALLKKFEKVVAVEKDEGLAEMLQEKFTGEIKSGRLKIVAGDILKINPTDLGVGFPSNYAVVANIPYYITGQFLREWLSAELKPKYMVLMLQKEVAQRIVARDGKESLLSISVKTFGEPSYVETIKRGSFFPIPNVDSAILKISNISKDLFPNLGAKLPNTNNSGEGKFFKLLRTGFAHKRKLLASNLKVTAETLAICGINPQARAENLSVDDWRCLSTKIATLK